MTGVIVDCYQKRVAWLKCSEVKSVETVNCFLAADCQVLVTSFKWCLFQTMRLKPWQQRKDQLCMHFWLYLHSQTPLYPTLLANIINQSPLLFSVVFSLTKNRGSNSPVPHLLKAHKAFQHPRSVYFRVLTNVCASTSGVSVMASAWVTATEL